ncbi:MAG: phosphoglycerate dehydrogenase [Peptococcaceae bacterium]|jgi:D-3-phosphoglycerate dehydrogenase|nr:phosphoglycerate dehydrogenase [Peptococcaceae bacterium]MDH7523834.1 phosphoglycerate dehydrogenase [Peptococcaceae bacterium]
MKVLVCDPISEKGIEVLKRDPSVEVDVKLKLSEEELCALVPEYQGIIVRSETKITKKILENCHQLKVVGRAGVGIDNIDVEAATLKGIVVVNTPDGNTISAAEHTMGMMLALARHIPQADHSLRQGQWNRSKYVGVELRSKKLGIIGFGKIGSEVGKRSKAFGMEIMVYDPYVTQQTAQRAGVELVDLDTLLRESDIITVHMPLTSETRHMICKEQFDKMKDGVRILNVARGGIIDEAALYEAIINKKVAGAALDVYEKEPLTQSPLFALPEVIVTPHLGASTQEAQVNVAIDVAYEILRVLHGEPVQNAVNIPFIKPELIQVIKPYIELMEKLGKLGGSLAEGPIDDIEIKYLGEIADYDLGSLTNTFLKGILRPFLHEAVNYVNAPLVAKQRGIKVREIKSPQTEDYTNKISVVIKGNGKWKRSFSGTVFKNNELRILSIDQFTLDIQPTGNLVIIMHRDRPRLVGQIGMILGDYNINIAGMQLDREEPGGKAAMILTVDQPVSPEVMELIMKVKDIKTATYVSF